jgi:2-polyprenyl-6-hydroxyphenyl methylase / 3-demethylubiquinone-9 3-methyltransferase
MQSYRGFTLARLNCCHRLLHSSKASRDTRSSIDRAEIEKFSAQAKRWWDPTGYAAPLHRLNPVRLAVIRAAIEKRMLDLGVSSASPGAKENRSRGLSLSSEGASRGLRPLEGVSVVDIGCGGGLVTEPIARLGANILGVDMALEGIEVAKSHMLMDPILADSGNLRYQVAAVEHLVRDGCAYDVVLALEIVEHVTEPQSFLQDCASLVKPGGILVISTLNRTAVSYILGIVAAERILKWLPTGTHNWTRFLTPEEISDYLHSKTDVTCDDVIGVSFNPLSNSFYISGDASVNYMLVASKPIVPRPVIDAGAENSSP